MTKAFGLLIFLTMSWLVGIAQDRKRIDSLKHELEISENDTLKLLYLLRIAEAFDEPKPDSAYYYATEELKLARKLNLRLSEALALNGVAYALKNLGNYPASLQTYLSANKILSDPSIERDILPIRYFRMEGFVNKAVTPDRIRLQLLGYNQLGLGLLYETTNVFDKALLYVLQAKESFEAATNVSNLVLANMILGRLYLSLNKKDSALIFEQTAYDLSIKWDYEENAAGIAINLGRIYLAMGNRLLATKHFRRAIAESTRLSYFRGIVAGNLLLYEVYQQAERRDSSVYFANRALRFAQYLKSPDLLLRTYTALAAFYSSIGKNDSTVKYQSLIISIKDNEFSSKQAQQFQAIVFDEKQRRQELEAAEKAYQDRIRLYALLIGLVTFFLVAIILWRSNRHKQRAYLLLKQQKQETDFQKAKVEHTLDELKSTQSQLIQSEKMASLGELTAGIAHEIQNPLNFVNNFSEVNEELLSEMKDNLSQGKIDDAITLANNALENQKKINHHGKRADAIVKGMLQHSRASASERENTNINTLVEEYVRLAFHGMRAKDKSFNTSINTNFGENVGDISIVPQDIGRVILNLLNNAFYAVAEKRKQLGDKFEPIVEIKTRRVDDKILIAVKDNGNGVASSVLDKIFQPFFTTKPTGQGTGLGLSLSYDIIKAHGGELKAETTEGEGSSFIFSLPSNKKT